MDNKNFYIGETVPFIVETRDSKTSDFIDPDSMKIEIRNNEILVNDDNMIKDSPGCYHYNWTSAAVGSFTIKYIAVYNNQTTIAKDNVTIIS